MSLKPIRHRESANGTLPSQTCKTLEGNLPGAEVYAAEGSKTEYIDYYTREDRRGQERKHWWHW